MPDVTVEHPDDRGAGGLSIAQWKRAWLAMRALQRRAGEFDRVCGDAAIEIPNDVALAMSPTLLRLWRELRWCSRPDPAYIRERGFRVHADVLQPPKKCHTCGRDDVVLYTLNWPASEGWVVWSVPGAVYCEEHHPKVTHGAPWETLGKPLKPADLRMSHHDHSPYRVRQVTPIYSLPAAEVRPPCSPSATRRSPGSRRSAPPSASSHGGELKIGALPKFRDDDRTIAKILSEGGQGGGRIVRRDVVGLAEFGLSPGETISAVAADGLWYEAGVISVDGQTVAVQLPEGVEFDIDSIRFSVQRVVELEPPAAFAVTEGQVTLSWPRVVGAAEQQRPARAGDTGVWTETATEERTPIRVTRDQDEGDDEIEVVPDVAPDAPPKRVPAREVTLDEEVDDG